jgi:uncharacterized protein (TIGR01370 family)
LPLNDRGQEWHVKLCPSRRRTLGFLGGFVSALIAVTRGATARDRGLPAGLTWVVFYGVDADPAVLSSFDAVVLDPAYRGSLEACASKGAKLFGYVSLGEASTTHAVVPLPKDRTVLLEENPSWPGTWRVDVRNPAWKSMILNEAIPRLVAQGFVGLFLDTLDTPPYLEEIQPERYRGMRAAAIELVRAIRREFPDMLLMMNRGYVLLDELAPVVDAVVAESFMTTYDSATQVYKWVEPNTRQLQLDWLLAARARAPSLRVLSLDYWDPQDSKTITKIYEQERALGHSPYVATIALDRIVPEPRK